MLTRYRVGLGSLDDNRSDNLYVVYGSNGEGGYKALEAEMKLSDVLVQYQDLPLPAPAALPSSLTPTTAASAIPDDGDNTLTLYYSRA